jgi:hypothetical protein
MRSSNRKRVGTVELTNQHREGEKRSPSRTERRPRGPRAKAKSWLWLRAASILAALELGANGCGAAVVGDECSGPSKEPSCPASGEAGSAGEGSVTQQVCGGIRGLGCPPDAYCEFPASTQCGSGDREHRSITRASVRRIRQPLVAASRERSVPMVNFARSPLTPAVVGPMRPVPAWISPRRVTRSRIRYAGATGLSIVALALRRALECRSFLALRAFRLGDREPIRGSLP